MTIEAMVVDLPLPVGPQMRKSPFLASRKALSAAVGQQTKHPAEFALGDHLAHAEAASVQVDGAVHAAGFDIFRNGQVINCVLVNHFPVAFVSEGFIGGEIEIAHAGIFAEYFEPLADG
jgi:hypothetical protein